MQSKRSFFNPTLYKKTLSRFWPLWVGSTLVGMLAPAMLLMSLLGEGYGWFQEEEFVFTLYSMVSTPIPTITLLYAAVCAMAVWGFLYNSRSVGMMHTLPVSRSAIFLTNTLSGLTMMLVPYVAVGLSVSLIALSWGFMDLQAVMITSLAVILMTLTFFGLASFCIMLTGNAYAFPVIYGAVNFLVPAVSKLLASLSTLLIPGATSSFSDLARDLSPIMGIYRHIGLTRSRIRPGEYISQLDGLGALAVYGAVGLLLLLAAWALYRSRHSECAGNVVAQKAMKPVFRYGLAVLCGLSVGWTVYSLLWGSIFQNGPYADRIVLGIAMVICAVLGFYAASMLLEKTVRVFQDSWRGALTVSALMVLVLTGLSYDLFGMSTRIPEPDKVALASVYTASYQSMDDSAPPLEVWSPEAVSDVLALHETIVGHTDEILAGQEDKAAMVEVTFEYQLNDGRFQRHQVYMPMHSENIDLEGSCEKALNSLYKDPSIQDDLIAIPEGHSLSNINIYANDRSLHLDKDALEGPQQMNAFYDALAADAAEGHLYSGDFPLYGSRFGANVSINLSILVPDLDKRPGAPNAAVQEYLYRYLRLNEDMTHTVAALKELGVLDENGQIILLPEEDREDGSADTVLYEEETAAVPSDDVISIYG